MPAIHTRFAGRIEYNDDAVIRIPAGLPPFVNQIRYLLLSDEQKRPLVFLQSVDEPGLCFIALPVQSIDTSYDLRIEPEDLSTIDAGGAALPDLVCLVILTFSAEGSVTANLMSPVVINLEKRLGVQAIRGDGRYSHAEPIGVPKPETENSCSY